MTIDLTQVAANAVPSVLAGIISAALTARWALSRFRSEKWWERKVDTYTAIARALFLVKRYVDDWISSYESRTENTRAYQERLLNDWHEGARAVEEATVLGSFVISVEAAEILRALKRAKSQGAPDDIYDEACTEAVALDKAIAAFVAAARNDLGIAEPRVNSGVLAP